MRMSKVKALANKVRTGFFATTDGIRPAVRPISAFIWVGGELWFATGVKSAKVADLRRRPRGEFCFMTKDYLHVRIAGRCRLSVRPEDKRKVFGAFPWMKNYFGSAEADDWLVVKLKPALVRYMDESLGYHRVKA